MIVLSLSFLPGTASVSRLVSFLEKELRMVDGFPIQMNKERLN
jgi:hypothetical protein